MRIEAFTQAKRRPAPGPGEADTNEDALLVLPGRAYAVMDGVTDRVGTRYDGVLSGRHASHTLQRTLERVLGGRDAPDPWAVVEAATDALRGVYEAHGTTDAVRADWNRQLASTLALVLLSGDVAHVVLVGDSGVRLNNGAVWQEHKDIDTVTAALRGHAWRLVAGRTESVAERERVSRAVAWSGTAHAAEGVAPWLHADDLHALARDTLATCRTLLPHQGEDALAGVIAGGIIHAQGGHQNNPGSPFGYPSLNGFPVPRGMVRMETVPRAGLHTVELWTDGYFAPASGFGVAAWEAGFADVERLDPHKVDAHPSVKGTTDAQWADDRTYLGVQL